MDRLCVADRENMRVTCPRAGLYIVQGKKEPALTIQQPDMGRVFGVAAKGKQFLNKQIQTQEVNQKAAS